MDRPSEGVTYLRQALALLPDNLQTIYGLALGLSVLDTVDADSEADGLFNRNLKEQPTSPIVVLTKNFAEQLFVKLHAGHARWFALGHAGDGRGDGWGLLRSKARISILHD